MGLSGIIYKIKSNFSRNSQIFPTRMHLMPTLRGIPLEFCNGYSAQKTRLMTYQKVQRLVISYMGIHLDTIPQQQTDIQTDIQMDNGHTDRNSKTILLHASSLVAC